MARVKTIKKARKSPGKCATCGRVIEAGESYYSWAFRYGGKHCGCSSHFPKPSQLTQSKMGTALAALEDAQDNLDGWGDRPDEKLPLSLENMPSEEDLKPILDDAASQLNDVASEYREAAEAMGGAGAENEERADTLETAASELENADFESFEDWKESNMDEGEEVTPDRIAEWVEAQRELAQDALNNAELG